MTEEQISALKSLANACGYDLVALPSKEEAASTTSEKTPSEAEKQG